MPNPLHVDPDEDDVAVLDDAPVARNRKRRPSGVAAVEIALLLPLLAFLFVIGTDFARVFYVSLTLTNCARSGALYASDPTAAAESPYLSVQHAALADAKDLSPAPTVTSTMGVDSTGSGYAMVTVSSSFSTITRFPGVPSQLQVTRSVRMPLAPTKPNG